jgi:hypothetical protein
MQRVGGGEVYKEKDVECLRGKSRREVARVKGKEG